MAHNKNRSRIMVFRPSDDELNNFNSYIKFMEKSGANEHGVAKIIPPKEWAARKNFLDVSKVQVTLENPILQKVIGRAGIYSVINISQKSMSADVYKEYAQSSKYSPPARANYKQLEEIFWKKILYEPPIYGADSPGSLMDKEGWNMSKFGSILDYVEKDYGVTIQGVNTPYLYFGMWKSMFCWHCEDMDLYSCNYLHGGASKFWYAIPPKHGKRFERVMEYLFPQEAKACPAFLRHKMNMVSPSVLEAHSIPYEKIVQRAGEIIITFPYGFHAGFNTGYNCAESINFASERWVEYGKWASQCKCTKDAVHINMDTFVKKFQPTRYFRWREGFERGYHPEDNIKKYRLVPNYKNPAKRSIRTVNLQDGKRVKICPMSPEWQPTITIKRCNV